MIHGQKTCVGTCHGCPPGSNMKLLDENNLLTSIFALYVTPLGLGSDFAAPVVAHKILLTFDPLSFQLQPHPTVCGSHAVPASLLKTIITTTKTSIPMAVNLESLWLNVQLGHLFDEGVGLGLLEPSPARPSEVLSPKSYPHIWALLTNTFRKLGLPDASLVRAHWGVKTKGEYVTHPFPKSAFMSIWSNHICSASNCSTPRVSPRRWRVWWALRTRTAATSTRRKRRPRRRSRSRPRRVARGSLRKMAAKDLLVKRQRRRPRARKAARSPSLYVHRLHQGTTNGEFKTPHSEVQWYTITVINDQWSA